MKQPEAIGAELAAELAPKTTRSRPAHRTPGMCPDESMLDYISADAVNISTLKELGRSALHYRYRKEHPRDTGPLRLGTTAHTAILEPERFETKYAVWDRTTKSGRAAPRNGSAWEAFERAHEGKVIVPASEYAAATAMRDAVHASDAAMKYLSSGSAEVSMYWSDTEQERLCKGRIDWLTRAMLPTYHRGPEQELVVGPAGMTDVIVGLKTARDCRGIGFGNAAARLGYHLQWAYYHDGFEALTGRSAKLVEIVVESFAPYDVAVYVIPNEVVEAGREEYRRLLNVLRDCELAGDWPGVASDEQTLSLPEWIYKDDANLSDIGLDMIGEDDANGESEEAG